MPKGQKNPPNIPQVVMTKNKRLLKFIRTQTTQSIPKEFSPSKVLGFLIGTKKLIDLCLKRTRKRKGIRTSAKFLGEKTRSSPKSSAEGRPLPTRRNSMCISVFCK